VDIIKLFTFRNGKCGGISSGKHSYKPGIERVQALADILRSLLCCHVHQLQFCAAPCCHSNETRAPIANPPSSAQLGAPPTIPPSYIRVRAVVWAYGEGQTDRQTRTHTHTDARDQYTFRVVYDSREM